MLQAIFCPSSGTQDCGLQHVVQCTKDVAVWWLGVRKLDRVEQHPTHRTHSQCFHAPGHRLATTWVQYTTCCKTQSCAPEDGQKTTQNMLSWLEYQ